MNKRKKETKEKKGKRSGNIREVLDGSFMTREIVMKNFSYVLLIAFLALLLIANRYHAEKIVRDTNKTEELIKEYRSSSITISSKLMEKSKLSSVAKLVNDKGLELKEMEEPAKKLK